MATFSREWTGVPDLATEAIATALPPRLRSKFWLGPAMLVAIHLALILLFAVLASSDLLRRETEGVMRADIVRYQHIAQTDGTPFRDFQVEYPPVSVAIIKLLSAPDFIQTAIRVALFTLTLNFGIAALLGIGWGRRAALIYLVLGAPLSWFVYLRLDLLAVFLALLAVVLARREKDHWSGVSLSLAFLTKIWPIILTPLLVTGRTGKRTWLRFSGPVGVGCIAWVLWGGWGAPAQVATFRGADGWQEESLVGSIVWGF